MPHEWEQKSYFTNHLFGTVQLIVAENAIQRGRELCQIIRVHKQRP